MVRKSLHRIYVKSGSLHDGSTTGTFELDSDADHAPVVSSPAVLAGDTAFFAVSGKVIENAAKTKGTILLGG